MNLLSQKASLAITSHVASSLARFKTKLAVKGRFTQIPQVLCTPVQGHKGDLPPNMRGHLRVCP